MRAKRIEMKRGDSHHREYTDVEFEIVGGWVHIKSVNKMFPADNVGVIELDEETDKKQEAPAESKGEAKAPAKSTRGTGKKTTAKKPATSRTSARKTTRVRSKQS